MTLAFSSSTRVGFFAAAILALLGPNASAAGASVSQPLGANLYTTFWVENSKTAIDWMTCGSTQESEGCFDFGTMSLFSRVCAVLRSTPKIFENTMTHEIYVLDAGSGSATDVTLKIFKQIDVVTTTSDTTTIQLARSTVLPVAGGDNASCSMAADDGFLFIGTNVSATAVRVAKKDLSMQTYGPFLPPIPVIAITADKSGYVAMVSADSSGTVTSYTVFAPDGSIAESGGGEGLILDNRNAYLPN